MKMENQFTHNSGKRKKCKVTIGDDLGKCFGIKKMTYFDLEIKYSSEVF
jgi:hypothetical protein